MRAQDSPFYGGGSTPPTYTPPSGTISPSPGTVDPFSTVPAVPYGSPLTGDPFLGGTAVPVPPGYSPFGPQPGTMYTFGLNGPQPFRYGWQGRYDFGLLPKEGTSNPNLGGLRIFEADLEKELVTPTRVGTHVLFRPAIQTTVPGPGPQGIAGLDAGLPPNAYRFGLGLKLPFAQLQRLAVRGRLQSPLWAPICATR